MAVARSCQLSLDEFTLVDLGVDWLTVTQKSGPHREYLRSLGEDLLAAERSHGGYIRAWSSYGYEGLHCGRVDCGTRHDGTILRLSSGAASKHWRHAYRLASGCSRIDLQLTFRVLRGPTKEIRSLHRKARRHRPKVGKAPVVTMLSGTDGACTLYLGKRTSDVFGRCYDKAAESKLECFSNCVRFETEFKGRMARAVVHTLFGSGNESAYIAARVSGFFSNRGASSRAFHSLPQGYLLQGKSHDLGFVSDESRSLAWLDKTVRPTVERLIEYNHLNEVLAALGLQRFAQNQNEGIKGG